MSKKIPEQQSEERFPDPSQEDMAILAMVPDGLYDEGLRIGRARSVWATCIRDKVEPLEEELEQINAVLNNRAMNLTASEAVKWLHDEYTAMCTPLQECCQKHKLGLGGESVAKVAVEAIEQKTAENVRLRALVQDLVDACHGDTDLETQTAHQEKTLAIAKQEGFVPTNTQDNG